MRAWGRSTKAETAAVPDFTTASPGVRSAYDRRPVDCPRRHLLRARATRSGRAHEHRRRDGVRAAGGRGGAGNRARPRSPCGAAGPAPPYSQRLSSARTGSWARPHWTQDERFDIRGHIRHASLPTPGSDEQLCDWTADFFSHPLDRARPLWETVLLEGLADGRWALGWKTHHCLVDGVGSVDVVGLMLDPEPVSGPAPAHGGVAAPAAHRPDSDDGDHRGPRLLRPPGHVAVRRAAGR